MKKTLTINLNNTVYYIDEDAYACLQSYLDHLRDYFQNEEGANEILSDIEARIAELFKERLRFGMQIITIREVEEVIAIMGHPEDFASDTSDTEDRRKTVEEQEEVPKEETNEPDPASLNKTAEKSRRRLFRDKDDAFLGGVASGLGYYFGVSTALIRILFVLFTFLTGYVLLIYLILWICIPEAKTAAQILEMKGEPVTIDNIKRFVSETMAKEEVISEEKTFGDYLLSGIKIVLKFCVIILGGCLAVGLLLFFLLLLFLLLSMIGGSIGFMTNGLDPFFMQMFSAVHMPWILALVSFVLLGIPAYAIIRLFVRRMFNLPAQPRWITVLLVVVWCLTFIFAISMWFVPSPDIKSTLPYIWYKI